MHPEPSIPFHMGLSVYVPLLLLGYLGVYCTLRVLVCSLRRFTSFWSEKGRDALGTRGMHLPPAHGRA